MAIPAESLTSLDNQGIKETGKLHINLSTEELIAAALERKEGELASTGAFCATTGEHTGRSPKDKFVVKDSQSEAHVEWGPVNQEMSPESFEKLKNDQADYLKGKELFVRDAFGGADKDLRIGVRVINEEAWANLFCKNLFIRPEEAELKGFEPDWTIVHTPFFDAEPAKHGTNTKTFIAVSFTEKLVLIGGTRYAGEMKKSIFSVLNYLYPLQGVLSMHCSANIAPEGAQKGALFFGLSGTGKTTLSASGNRKLIGDDEHGWGEKGIFNFEGGCYAKCIDLTEEKEPQIWKAIRNGAILENVVLEGDAKVANYENTTLTENTRVAYPLEHIDGAVLKGTAEHPENIVFLTCDAFGVMPPISKLSPEQAMYHFLSGYTAKVAGTEAGMGSSPQATFSTCFGAPFLPLRPKVYADLLGEKMTQHKVNCWLVNTGWVGGAYGTGNRIKLSYTRRMVNAAITSELEKTNFVEDSIFGLAIPEKIEGIPEEVLHPEEFWADKDAYKESAKKLAGLFRDNFKTFAADSPELEAAGPKA